MKVIFGLLLLAISSTIILDATQEAFAVVIDNDIPSGTQDHFDVDVLGGGEAFTAHITANPPTDAQVIFDYFTFIDINGIGNAGGNSRLSSSVTVGASETAPGSDVVTSSGSFTGSGGNTIDWTATSSIGNGDLRMITEYTFTAQTGTLGTLSLLQYLDEDVPPNFANCDLFISGTSAGGDLELFTLDDILVFGVSQSGAFNGAQGLSNAGFDGFASKQYFDLLTDLQNGMVSVSPTGVIGPVLSGLPPNNLPGVGAVIGPEDITTVLSYTVDPSATTATIVTSLGGVPDASAIGPQIVGGITIPIDSTSLLLSGIQTSVMWLLPAIVSSTAIGLLVIRRK